MKPTASYKRGILPQSSQGTARLLRAPLRPLPLGFLLLLPPWALSLDPSPRRCGPARDAGEVSYGHLYSLGIPPAGLSAPANLNTWPVLCLQFTFHRKVSQNHCHLGRWWGRGCPFLGTPQATQPLAGGYGEGNLLCKERGEQPCIKNSGCAHSEAGSSSSLTSMESWPTSWLSAPFPRGSEAAPGAEQLSGGTACCSTHVCAQRNAPTVTCHFSKLQPAFPLPEPGFLCQQDFLRLLEPVLQTSVMGLNCQGTRPLWTAFNQGPTADGSPLPRPRGWDTSGEGVGQQHPASPVEPSPQEDHAPSRSPS